MLAPAIFVISFLCLFGFTVIVPTLPPGEIFYVFLDISGINSPISGISGDVFAIGLINGLFWGTIILMIYGLISRFSKRETFLSAKSANYPSLSKSTSDYIPPYIPPRTVVKRPRYKARKRKTYTSLDKNIEAIEGVGRIYGDRLRNSGVWTLNDLLRKGATRNKRYYLAKKVGVSYSTILGWVYQADFFRIAGIGKQYSSLLESAGVNSVTELSIMNPDKLYTKLIETNLNKNLVRRTPPYNMVENWIDSAKNLRHIVTY
jgi:predicted flap endonuclease-1-like 5' DNA nuclease